MDLKITLPGEVDADNPVAHDLYLDGGQMVFIDGAVDDAEAYSREVAQSVLTRLLHIRGEWYLDQRKGTPWREKIWGKAGVVSGEASIRRVIRSVVADTPGIASVESVDVSIDRQARTLTLSIDATTDRSTPVTIAELDAPMIVRL